MPRSSSGQQRATVRVRDRKSVVSRKGMMRRYGDIATHARMGAAECYWGRPGGEALLLKKPKTSAPREPPSGRYTRLLRFSQCKVKGKAKKRLFIQTFEVDGMPLQG
jgi:hypothetical protein